MPDRLRAADLNDRYLGRRVRVDGHEGILRAVTHVDDSLVQVLLVGAGPPIVPIVGAGVPVDLLD